MSFPAYPSYKDSGVEWHGLVPDHWRVAPIKYAVSCNDEVLPDNTDADFEIQYLEISDVDLMSGVKGTTAMKYGSSPSRARRRLRDGDVVVSTVRTYLKAIAQIDSPAENLIASTGFAVLRARESIWPKFIGYAVQAERFIAEVISRSVGVSYPAINSSDLVAIKAFMPPLDEQKSIAKFLDHETAKIDALIHEQELLNEILLEKRKSIVSAHVFNGNGEWRKVRLKELFRPAKRQGYETHEVLSVYREYGVILKNSRSDNFNKTPENLGLYQLVEEGDLVVNKMKAWQGSLGISPHEGITSPDYLVFSPLSQESSEFLHHLLRTQEMADFYLTISNGIRTNQWRLEEDKFLASHIYLPTLDEQNQRVAIIRSSLIEVDELSRLAKENVSLLQERRSVLISSAVTGKIDVRGFVAPAVQ